MEADCSKLLKEAEEYEKGNAPATLCYVDISSWFERYVFEELDAMVVSFEEATAENEALKRKNARALHTQYINQFRKSYKGK